MTPPLVYAWMNGKRTYILDVPGVDGPRPLVAHNQHDAQALEPYLPDGEEEAQLVVFLAAATIVDPFNPEGSRLLDNHHDITGVDIYADCTRCGFHATPAGEAFRHRTTVGTATVRRWIEAQASV